MRHRILTAVTAAAGITVAAVALQVGTATAGHTNQLLEATLDGRAEVADKATDRRIVGDPNGTGEAYVFEIDGETNKDTLCYVLTVEGIEPGTAAHIHEGQPGDNGPVVVNLAAPAGGQAADCLKEGRILPNGKPAFEGDQTAAEIIANPGNYYVNVHNAEYPGGAIRGQLAPQG